MFYQKIHPRLRLRPLPLLARVAFLAAVLVAVAGCAARKPPEVRNFSTVVVDAGHGGHDSGTIGYKSSRSARSSRSSRNARRSRIRSGGARILEKDLALDVARRLRTELQEGGLRVVMTRADDRFIPLDGRVAISNRHRKHAVFVSIHFNHSPKRFVHGAEVYHNGQGTEELARRIVRALATVPGMEDRGVRRADFRVLRKSSGPALLVECGYLSHTAELARCATPAYRQRLAEAIARALFEQRR